MYATGKAAVTRVDAAANFEIESFWRVFPATPATTAIERRWLNDDAVRRGRRLRPGRRREDRGARLRCRDYQRGRLTWSQATGVKEMRGNILTEYKRTGVVTSPIYGAPSTDETGTPDGIGRYNHFAGGGSICWTANTESAPRLRRDRGPLARAGLRAFVPGLPGGRPDQRPGWHLFQLPARLDQLELDHRARSSTRAPRARRP